MGLGHRYGRRMQTISGIHYNWSLPGSRNDEYFGADPQLPPPLLPAAVPVRRLAGGVFELRRRARSTSCSAAAATRCTCRTAPRCAWGGWATRATRRPRSRSATTASRATRASLQDALTRPYPPYEAVGIRNPGGDYNQLATSLLQIENEFYGTIRPEARDPPRRAAAARAARARRRVRRGALHGPRSVRAGRHRRADTMRFLDIFLLHCLLTRQSARHARGDRRAGAQPAPRAARGREPGLRLERGAGEVPLVDWGAEILEASRRSPPRWTPCTRQRLPRRAGGRTRR